MKPSRQHQAETLKAVPPAVNRGGRQEPIVPKLCLGGAVGVAEERRILTGREQHFYTGRKAEQDDDSTTTTILSSARISPQKLLPGGRNTNYSVSTSSRGPPSTRPTPPRQDALVSPRRVKTEAFSLSARSQQSRPKNKIFARKRSGTSLLEDKLVVDDKTGKKVQSAALASDKIEYKVSTCKTPRGQNAYALHKLGLETGKFKTLRYPHLTKNLGLSYGTHFDHGQIILKVAEDPFQFGEKAQEFEDALHQIYETYKKADTVDPEKLPEMIMKLFPGDMRPSILADFKRELLEVLEADISTLSDEDVFVELTNYILEHQPRGVAKPYMVENSVTGKDVFAGQLALRNLFNHYKTEAHRIMRSDIGEVLHRLGVVDSLEDFYDSRIEEWLEKRTNAKKFDEEPDLREILELSDSLDFHELTDLVNYLFHFPACNDAVVGAESCDSHKIAPASVR